MQLYVSPHGDDRWSGRMAEPNAQRTDGPLATIPAAQQAVRGLKQQGPWTEPVTVFLRGGRYELAETLVFAAGDSGQREKTTWNAYVSFEQPVIYAAYAGETPVISGGRRIAGWRVEKLRGKTAWVADLPAVKGGRWHFRQLWVNGQRRYRPRLPQTGEHKVAQVLDACYEGDPEQTWFKGATRFGYAEGQFRADWRNLPDVEIQFLTLWVCMRTNVQAVNEADRVVTMDRNSGMRLTSDFSKEGAPFVIENVFEALAEPGQWYLDRGEGKLYYLPLPGEDPQTADVVAPCLCELVRLEGGEAEEEAAECLRFEGLTFAYNEWTPPADYARSSQACTDVPGAITARHARNCAFHNCQFVHLGTYAVDLAEACRDIAIRGCHLRDLGAGGVKIWHGCRRNIVADCEIGDGGILYPSAVGVLIGKASGNQVLHNHIHDLYYSGVSVGWTWGYAEGDAYGNLIEWNHIHDIGKGKLSDMGGVYCLGVQPGTRIRYNLIHHVRARSYGGWALYTDEGSSHILLEHNICHDTSKQGFHQHYGRENVVRNNIFAFAGDSQLIYSRVEPHLGFVFERNIVIGEGLPMWQNDYGPKGRRMEADLNLYWDVRGTPVLNADGETRRGLSEWQALGYDRRSIVADPRCADLAARNFALAADSPALALGFMPIDLTDVGPRPGGNR